MTAEQQARIHDRSMDLRIMDLSWMTAEQQARITNHDREIPGPEPPPAPGLAGASTDFHLK